MSMYPPPLHPDFPHGLPKSKAKSTVNQGVGPVTHPPSSDGKGGLGPIRGNTPDRMIAANGPGPERYGPSPTATAAGRKVKATTRSATLPVPGGGLLVTAAWSPHAGSGAKVGGKAGKGQKGLPK